jgi:hypothetical protein
LKIMPSTFPDFAHEKALSKESPVGSQDNANVHTNFLVLVHVSRCWV